MVSDLKVQQQKSRMADPPNAEYLRFQLLDQACAVVLGIEYVLAIARVRTATDAKQ